MIEAITITTVGLGIFWMAFGWDTLASWKERILENATTKDKVTKIAQVKLVSDDRKDIEKFVTDNAKYLSNDTVKKLVARIEAIKDDNIIKDDDIRSQIDALNKRKK